MKRQNLLSLGLVTTFVLAGCLAANAQGVGVFTSTSPSAVAHEGHTATLLTNRKVLVVGGNSDISFAELYDPTTAAWSPTVSLGTDGPVGHTATLLGNGQVLVAGGFYYGNFGSVMVAGGELYDPGMAYLDPFVKLVKLGDGSLQIGFINGSGPSHSVLASTNAAAPVNTWSNLGAATEMPVGSGLFQFTDHQAPNYPQRFYRVSSP